jgi:hypothetical protein
MRRAMSAGGREIGRLQQLEQILRNLGLGDRAGHRKHRREREAR